MLLMISLLFVLSFQALSYFAVTNDTGCTIVGMILHFSWLSVFTSMQACNFHMFKVFTSIKPRSPTGSKFFSRNIIKSIAYVYGVPLLVVLLHVTITSIVTQGMSIGYGGTSCTFQNRYTHILSGIIPIAIICVSNILIFIFTARTIYNTPKPERSHRDRNEMIIFLRLTSITGACWFLQLIDGFLPLSAFSYIAVICSSLQGLYIFLAFVVNKRNFAMMKEKVMMTGKSNENKTSTIKTTSTRL